MFGTIQAMSEALDRSRKPKVDFMKNELKEEALIDSGLRRECAAILKPYSNRKGRSLVFVLETILPALEHAGILEHDTLVGLLYGSIYQKFYDPLHFFEGLIPGLIHDVGKYEQADLFKMPGIFSEEQRKLAKNHVADTSYIIGNDYPTLDRLVRGHHLHGQPDPYPSDDQEKNKRMISLRRAFSVADKAAASIELRPGLSAEEEKWRQTPEGRREQINRLYKWFEPENSRLVPQQIDYIQQIIQQKMVFTPYNEGDKITISNDDYREKLIRSGNLNPDGTSLAFSIIDSSIYGVAFVNQLVELTKPKGKNSCKLTFVPATQEGVLHGL